MLALAGWIVQSRDELNLHAGPGVAVREVPTPTGPADYILFLDSRACGALEAKPEGVTLSGVVPHGADYAGAAPQGYPVWGDPLPFVYVSKCRKLKGRKFLGLTRRGGSKSKLRSVGAAASFTQSA